MRTEDLAVIRGKEKRGILEELGLGFQNSDLFFNIIAL